MENTELRICHKELFLAGWFYLAASIFLFCMLGLADGPLWLAVLGICLILAGFLSLMYLGFCEQVLTPEGICLRQPFFPDRQCKWEDILQIGVLVGSAGKTPAPVLAITTAGGRIWEAPESYGSWLRHNPNTHLEVDYNSRTRNYVLRYYGPLDFDEWKKPPQH